MALILLIVGMSFLDLLIDGDDPHWHGNVYVDDPDE